MATFQFLHAADLHIDSPLRGLEAEPDAPADRIRTATRAAYTNLVDLALHDASRLRPDRRRPVRRRVAGLAHRPVLRPARPRASPAPASACSASAATTTPPASSPAGSRCPMARACCPPISPQSIRLAELNVVHPRHGLLRPQRPRERRAALSVAARGPSQHRHAAHLGHGPRHARDLRAVHRPSNSSRMATTTGRSATSMPGRSWPRNPCWIVFPGNTQGRHIREAGPKGATLVTVQRRPDRGRRASRSRRGPLGAVAGRSHRLRQPRMTPLPRSVPNWTPRSTPPVTACLPRASCCLARPAAHPALVRDLGATRDKLHAEAAGVRHGNDLARKRRGAHAPRARHRRDASALRRRGTAGARTGQRQRSHFATQVQSYCATLLNRSRLLRDALGDDHPAVQAASGSTTPDLLESARNLLLARLAEG